MTEEQSRYLAERLNSLGSLLYCEVNGTQHRFKLRISELSPTSVIFDRNKDHIEDTEYTLIPIQSAGSIYNIGKKIFSQDLATVFHQMNDQLTGYDFMMTPYGRFLASHSLPHLKFVSEGLELQMHERADRTVAEGYESYFRDAFIRAYNFFSFEQKEFREQLKVLSGEMYLFWSEVERIYDDMKAIENELRRAFPQRRPSIKDFEKPDLKTAFKLRYVPRSYEEYRGSLGFSFVHTGFHPLSFKDREWSEEFWKVNEFSDACRIVFGRGANAPSESGDLFS